jgi:hypothetical protein
MSPQDFNEWRAQNDLPILFEYLGGMLPQFRDWQESLPFDLSAALRIVPTGALFKGLENKTVIKRPSDDGKTFVHECFEGTAVEAKKRWGARSRQIEVLGEIEPYFKWAKKTLGRGRFFMYDKANSQITDDLVYRSWLGANEYGQVTQAYLFNDFPVLKLGQITLSRRMIVGSRNLDFCDLDFLRIEDDFHGSYWTTVHYSSVRDIEFSNASFAFLTFHKCAVETFTATNSKLQDLYFEFTDVREFKLKDCFVFRMGFMESDVTPFIQTCEIREVNYAPKKGASPTQVARTYRLLRAGYQSSGLRQEAADCYYRERVFERKSYFHPYCIDEKAFRGIVNGGRLRIVYDAYNRGLYDKVRLRHVLVETAISKLKMLTFPKFLIPLAKYRLRWIASAFESVLWGYGERPLRILSAALSVIVSYSIAYRFNEWVGDSGARIKLSMFDSAYFSVVTFTTLGYGDIKPTTTLLKYLAGSEALLGACMIGLTVAGFSNRSKY